MEIYIIIIIIFFLILFIPTSKYLSNRLGFVVLLIVKLKRKKYNKYGSLFSDPIKEHHFMLRHRIGFILLSSYVDFISICFFLIEEEQHRSGILVHGD